MSTTTIRRKGFWSQSHYLDRMTFKDLVVAYLQYPAIIIYLGLAAVSIGAWFYQPASIGRSLLAIAVSVLLFPVVWYFLHRWVLHSQWMWKVPWLAGTWKRIHYDHHQDPNHLEVLFGSPANVVPTVALATIPVGYAIGGFGGAAAAFATGLIQTCVNEFFHCIQHLNYQPQNAWLRRIKKLHMAHHFHNENGNFGIVSFWVDRLAGTAYEEMTEWPRSRTVFNLGYDEAEAARFPWVAALSPGRRRRNPAPAE